MFGGIPENDFFELPEIWKSNNGSKWTLITDELTLRKIRTSRIHLSADQFIFINARQGLWRSFFGDVWEPVNIEEKLFQEVFFFKTMRSRGGFASATHNGYLYILGGWNYPTHTERYSDLLNDVWRSSDGTIWERMSVRQEETDKYMDNFDTFPARSGHEVVSFRGMLYLTGGYGEGERIGPNEWKPTSYRDAWVSPDGKNWYELVRVEE